MTIFNFVLWQADPEIFSLGSWPIRWYGLLFAMGFIVGQRIIARFFKYNGYDEKLVDTFVIYSVVGTVVGARLGHVFFYGPYFTPDGTGYFDDPISIIMVNQGGLASHGAMLGLLISTFIFYKKKIQEKYLWITDRLVITVALAGCFIRFGNLMNSEIIGTPTDAPQAFVFSYNTSDFLSNQFQEVVNDVTFESKGSSTELEGKTYLNLSTTIYFDKNQIQTEEVASRLITEQIIPSQHASNFRHKDHEHVFFPDTPTVKYTTEGDQLIASLPAYGIPRHPSQLYESLSSLAIFILLFFLMDRVKGKLPEGLTTGIFFVTIFTLRFIYEFFKENQVAMEDGWALNMGQWLSIPAVLFGIFLILYSRKNNSALEK